MTEKKSSEVLHDAFVWTIKDVARELQVSERHIYKLMSEIPQKDWRDFVE